MYSCCSDRYRSVLLFEDESTIWKRSFSTSLFLSFCAADCFCSTHTHTFYYLVNSCCIVCVLFLLLLWYAKSSCRWLDVRQQNSHLEYYANARRRQQKTYVFISKKFQITNNKIKYLNKKFELIFNYKNLLHIQWIYAASVESLVMMLMYIFLDNKFWHV